MNFVLELLSCDLNDGRDSRVVKVSDHCWPCYVFEASINKDPPCRGAIVLPARISSQSSRHCWTSPLPHASALIQRDFGCVLGLQQIKQLPHVAKVDLPRVVAHYPVEIWLWPSPKDKEGQLAPTPRRCSAGCLKYRQCVLEECESDIPYHNTRCRTSVAMDNTGVQHPLSTESLDSNPTIVMLQTDA
ncbi:hypothetical protein TNCV_2121251 [Trichonephila clavipes]|nr:hypothetical protein TNCV_2121251 [Trichonephila clavipes]